VSRFITIPKAKRCICIERDTERVLQCQVLRCQERARRNFVIDQGQGRLSETMVCEPHAAALKAGERYVYDSVENVIYMGRTRRLRVSNRPRAGQISSDRVAFQPKEKRPRAGVETTDTGP
jgi:hypothetical protein